MAVTYQDYTGNGSETDYDVTFDFLETSDVKVSIDGTTKNVVSDYTVNGSSTPPVLTFTSNSIPANNTAIRIYRNTDADSAKHTYQAGSSVKAGDLNNNQTQILYRLQEIGTVTGNTQGLPLNTGNKNDITVNSATDWVIRDGVVAESMLADNSIDSRAYVDGSIDTVHIANDAVDATKIVANAITDNHLAADSVGFSELKADSVNGNVIQDDSIGSEHIKDDAVDSAELAAGAVDIAHLSASGTKNNTTFLRGDNSFAVPAYTGLFSSYAILKHVESQGTHGGSSGTSWTTRIINTEDADPDGIVSISSNQFTLQAGNYFINAAGSAHDLEYCKLRIYDITNSAERILGHVGAGGTFGYAWNVPNQLTGRLTPSGTTAYELQQISGIARSSTGHGHATSMGGNETYTTIQIFKEL